MTIAFVKESRGLPFLKIGMRVLVDGEPGKITSTHGANLMVMFDKWKVSHNCHPYWRITYLDKEGFVITEFGDNGQILLSRDDTRSLIKTYGITSDNITEVQLSLLFKHLSQALKNTASYEGTYRLSSRKPSKFMECKTKQWAPYTREAISFNSDGFIGFAGWAGSNNVQPILRGVTNWIAELSKKSGEIL